MYSHKGTNPVLRAPASWPNYPSKRLQTPANWELEFQHVSSERTHSVHGIHAGCEAEIPSSGLPSGGSLRGLTLHLLGSSRHGPRGSFFCALGESSIAQGPAVPLLGLGWKQQGREMGGPFSTSSLFFPIYDLCGPESCFSVFQTQRTPRILGPLCGPSEPHTCVPIRVEEESLLLSDSFRRKY